GPRSTGDDRFRERCWQAFAEWCASERVVAEFVRFNPLVRNEGLAPPELQVVLDRETVAVPLDGDSDALWQSYRSVHRNMVRKAEAAALEAREVDPAAHLAEFCAIYAETLDRLDADRSYAFAPSYFES